MRILILANPVSGRGRAPEVADAVSSALQAAGHATEIRRTRPGGGAEWVRELLAGRDLLAVAGGDGAIRTACVATAGTGVPLYHLPCGTENLFARDWGMDCTPGLLLRTIAGGRVEHIDLGRAGGDPFILMVSVGLDAEVIDDLATRRRGAIRHRHYAGPIWRQWVRWRPPRLRVDLDGDRVDQDRTGMAIVGNSRQYAMRLDPVARADPTDGALDLLYYPVRSRWRLLRFALACRRRRQLALPDVVYRRGSRVTIEADEPFRYQMDGERPEDGRTVRRLEVTIQPAAVAVLAPPATENG